MECIPIFRTKQVLIDRLDFESKKKVPIYNLCKELKSFISEDGVGLDYVPFYSGTIIYNGTEITLLSIKRDFDFDIGLTGYLLIRHKNSKLLQVIKVLTPSTDQVKNLSCFYKNGYFLLQEVNDPNYDTSDNSHKKCINITRCLLKTSDDSKLIILDSIAANPIINKLFMNEAKNSLRVIQ